MKKFSLKTILLIILALVVLLQFIRPARTNSSSAPATGSNDISHVVNVPADVRQILSRSCYDCHSNRTEYPWYSNIQPVGLWLDHHVHEGVHELNFTEFATYKRKRQLHKLDEIAEITEAHEMPLSSYTWIHKDAELSQEQEQRLISWARGSRETLAERDSSSR
jgi:hypothetical protein